MTTKDNAIILYQSPDGEASLEVRLDHESVWLTQAQLADLFAVKIPAINKHLKNIFTSGELMEEAVISILETTAADGKNYQINMKGVRLEICCLRDAPGQAERFQLC